MKSVVRHLLLMITFVFGLTGQANAEVVFKSSAAFETKNTIKIEDESAATVFARFVSVKEWWDPEHTWTGNSENLKIDLNKMLFLESGTRKSLDSKIYVEHASVIFVLKDQMMRLRGALGPLQSLPVNGVLTVNIVENDGATEVTFEYKVSGNINGNLGEVWAAAVDSVLGHQLRRLNKSFDKL